MDLEMKEELIPKSSNKAHLANLITPYVFPNAIVPMFYKKFWTAVVLDGLF